MGRFDDWLYPYLFRTTVINMWDRHPACPRGRQDAYPQYYWRRGISYLKIGLWWLQGVVHKGRELLTPIPLLPKDPQPVFASKWAEQDFYDEIWFSRVRSLTYQFWVDRDLPRCVRQSARAANESWNVLFVSIKGAIIFTEITEIYTITLEKLWSYDQVDVYACYDTSMKKICCWTVQAQ